VRVVFDANVVIAGAGWRRESHLCLVQAARRRVIPYATLWIHEETRRAAQSMEARRVFKRHSPWTVLNWWFSFARGVEPAALGKQRSRDAKDDPYLACALAASARLIVSLDEDLLTLEKPFGIEIVTPRTLLSRLQRSV
jgi:putative PIN family toxin of toxin-antitoxin system